MKGSEQQGKASRRKTGLPRALFAFYQIVQRHCLSIQPPFQHMHVNTDIIQQESSRGTAPTGIAAGDIDF